MQSDRLQRLAGGVAGLLLVVVSATILAVSLVANPWFSFAHNSISDLGRRSARLGTVYNGGLVVVAVLFAFLCSQVYRDRESRVGRVAVALFGSTGLGLLLIGFLSNGVSLPDPYALGFALTGGTGVVLFGAAMAARGGRYARPFVGIVVIGVLGAMAAIVRFDGLAIAELIAIAGYYVTICILSVRLLHGPR